MQDTHTKKTPKKQNTKFVLSKDIFNVDALDEYRCVM